MSNNIIRYVFPRVAVPAILIFLTSCAHLRDSQNIGASEEAGSSVIKVCEGIYRGPRPHDLNELRSLRVRTILNLENDTEAVIKEETAAKGLGMETIKLPMSDIVRPKPGDLLKAAEIMEDPKLQPVYVHCRHGRDRTGLAVAAYRIIHDGWSVGRAYQEATDNGHSRLFYDLLFRWEKSLRELSARKPVAKPPAQDGLSSPVPSAS